MVRDLELRIENVQAGIARQQEERIAQYAEPGTRGRDKPMQGVHQAERGLDRDSAHVAAQGRSASGSPRLTRRVQAAQCREGRKLASIRTLRRSRARAGAKGYWARPTELFARAFEAYVFDRIKDRGNVSQYLVQGVEATASGDNSTAATRTRPARSARRSTPPSTSCSRRSTFAASPRRAKAGRRKALYQVAADNKPPFYSALERAIDSSGQNRAPASQWLATLKKVPGVKQEELSGLASTTWLKMQEGPVDKQAPQPRRRDSMSRSGPIQKSRSSKAPHCVESCAIPARLGSTRGCATTRTRGTFPKFTRGRGSSRVPRGAREN
jgi:hypothetical protein